MANTFVAVLRELLDQIKGLAENKRLKELTTQELLNKISKLVKKELKGDYLGRDLTLESGIIYKEK